MEHFLLSDTEKEELKQFIGADAELPDMLNARERRGGYYSCRSRQVR